MCGMIPSLNLHSSLATGIQPIQQEAHLQAFLSAMVCHGGSCPGHTAPESNLLSMVLEREPLECIDAKQHLALFQCEAVGYLCDNYVYYQTLCLETPRHAHTLDNKIQPTMKVYL